MRPVRWRAAIAALAAAAGLTGCAQGPSGGAGPAVILVTLDTFRADHLGCAGNPWIRTPHLDRLARSARQWSRAVTPIPLTTPSHATILSGLTPPAHGVLRNRMVLPQSVTTIAELLRDAGYRTGAVVSSAIVLGPQFTFDQGFDRYVVIEPEVRPASGQGEMATDAAVEWLRTSGGPGSFLWLHYFDTHIPYLPPPPLDRLYDPDYDGAYARPTQLDQKHFRENDVDPRDVEHLAALYAGEVTFVDACVGRVTRAEEAQGAVILVTADHGEGLWEHERYFGHDILLYDTALRVPLILAGTGTGLSREPARTTDVAPTLLRLCGGEPAPAMEGRDLLGDPPPEGDGLSFVAETYPARGKGRPLYAVRTERRKVIWLQRDRRHEFYDLERDPQEKHDLGEGAGEHFRMLAGDLEIDLRTRARQAATAEDGAGGKPDAATREALRTLGYVD